LDKTLQEESFTVDAVLTEADVLDARAVVKMIVVDASIKNYIVSVVGATRKHPSIVLGVSPAAANSLMRAAQAAALVTGGIM